MLPIAGQTAGLNFFVDTQGWPGCYMLKKSRFFFKCSHFFNTRATPGPPACISSNLNFLEFLSAMCRN